MAMELQYAVNLLASLPKNINHDAVNSADTWEFFQKILLMENIHRTGIENFQNSMGRLFAQCNRESVRKTMLMHEEIFKEQVRELHRLYRVQKMLMGELGSKGLKIHQLVNPSYRVTQAGPDFSDMDNQTGFWSLGTSSCDNYSPSGNWHHCAITNSGHNLHQAYSVRADPSSLEWSSSCSGDAPRIPRGFDLKIHAEEDLSTDVSAIEEQVGPTFWRPSKDKVSIGGLHDSQFYTEGDHDVELTLSIGYGTSKRKSSNWHPHPNHESGMLNPSTFIKSDREECSNPTNTMDTAPRTFTRESLQQAPWLFHSLSLNRT